MASNQISHKTMFGRDQSSLRKPPFKLSKQCKMVLQDRSNQYIVRLWGNRLITSDHRPTLTALCPYSSSSSSICSNVASSSSAPAIKEWRASLSPKCAAKNERAPIVQMKNPSSTSIPTPREVAEQQSCATSQPISQLAEAPTLSRSTKEGGLSHKSVERKAFFLFPARARSPSAASAAAQQKREG